MTISTAASQVSVRAVVALAVLATSLIARPASASVIYMITSPPLLWTLDVDTFAMTPLSYSPPNEALSIAAGDSSSSLFVMRGSGQIDRYDIASQTGVATGVQLFGNSFGEGPDGYWYVGNGRILSRLLPGDPTYAPIAVGAGASSYAGDLATAPGGMLIGATTGGDIVSVDTGTGAQTPLIHTAMRIFGLATSADGRVFVGTDDGRLFEADLATGGLVYRATLGVMILDLASERTIPGPHGLVVLLAGSGVLLGRARKRVKQ